MDADTIASVFNVKSSFGDYLILSAVAISKSFGVLLGPLKLNAAKSLKKQSFSPPRNGISQNES